MGRQQGEQPEDSPGAGGWIHGLSPDALCAIPVHSTRIEKLVNPKVRLSEEGFHVAGRLHKQNSCDLTRFSVGDKNRIWQALQNKGVSQLCVTACLQRICRCNVAM